MNTNTYGETSGSDSRESRLIMESLMVFSLADEVARLRQEEPWTDGDRNSRTLAKEVDFRVLVSVLRDGAMLEEKDGDARVSLQVIEGRATLRLHGTGGTGGTRGTGGGEDADLEAGDLATVDAGQSWQLQASGDCAVLLTFAWPREKAGV